MEIQRPILSLCLPTNGVVEWVVPTLESIYNQNVEYDLFEVVITDNGDNSHLEEALKEYDYPNLKYFRTNDKGFLNLVTCLQKGTGVFNKMLNHRMMIKPGMLQQMISIVEKNISKKPVMYFLNGNTNLPEFNECKNFDEFIYKMNYWVSWSAGIGFWDVDLPKLSEIKPNEMFPNASLLFEHRLDSDYFIWNGVYGQMQDESGKGGYDLFYTFAVVLNELLNNLRERERISENTLLFVRRKLFVFLRGLYYSEVIKRKTTKYSFLIRNVRRSVTQYYGQRGYLKMLVYAYLCYIKNDVFTKTFYPK